MDIAGAKALKDRLGPNGADEAQSLRVAVPAEAPPVYHWVGVDYTPSLAPSADVEDGTAADGASLFARLGLSFR